MHYEGIHNNSNLRSRRRELRNNLSPAEAVLWNYIKGSKLKNKKFRRQHSIGNYIVDFYCPDSKLVIELDGETHNNEASFAHDEKRTQFLQSKGLRVIRFTNIEVRDNLEGVLGEIVKQLT